jgi:dUTP pyrophosphatase
MAIVTRRTVKFKKLVPEATLPTYAHDGDIGLDVFAVSMDYDEKNDVYIYHTGLACETSGHMGILGMMKSSIYKHGDAYLVNAVGLIDSDQYRGEICFIYKNRTSLEQRAINNASIMWPRRPFWWRLIHTFEDEIEYWRDMVSPYPYAPYKVGEAIGQLVPLTFDHIDIQEVKELSSTERGEGGFGSSEASKKKPTKKSNKKVKEQ